MAQLNLQEYQSKMEDLLRQGQTDEVVAHAGHILTRYPKNLMAHRALAEAHLATSQVDDAERAFRRVLSAIPSDPQALVGLGQIAAKRGKHDEAIWYLERAYEQDPADTRLLAELRELYSTHRGVKDAKIQLGARAIAEQQVRTGLYHNAINTLQSALVHSPDRADLRILLAQVLWETGARIESAELASEVLKSLPNCLPANKILTDLWLGERRPSDAQRYLSVIETLDPYLAFEIVQGTPPPPNAYVIDELDYQSEAKRQLSTLKPDWLGSLGGDDDDSYDFEEVSDFDTPEDRFSAPVTVDDGTDFGDLFGDSVSDVLDEDDGESFEDLFGGLTDDEPALTGDDSDIANLFDDIPELDPSQAPTITRPPTDRLDRVAVTFPPDFPLENDESAEDDDMLDFPALFEEDDPTEAAISGGGTGLTGLLSALEDEEDDLLDDSGELDSKPEFDWINAAERDAQIKDTSRLPDDVDVSAYLGDVQDDSAGDDDSWFTAFDDSLNDELLEDLTQPNTSLLPELPADTEEGLITDDALAWLKDEGIELLEDDEIDPATAISDPYDALDDDFTIEDPNADDPFAWMHGEGIEIVDEEKALNDSLDWMLDTDDLPDAEDDQIIADLPVGEAPGSADLFSDLFDTTDDDTPIKPPAEGTGLTGLLANLENAQADSEEETQGLLAMLGNVSPQDDFHFDEDENALEDQFEDASTNVEFALDLTETPDALADEENVFDLFGALDDSDDNEDGQDAMSDDPNNRQSDWFTDDDDSGADDNELEWLSDIGDEPEFIGQNDDEETADEDVPSWLASDVDAPDLFAGLGENSEEDEDTFAFTLDTETDSDSAEDAETPDWLTSINTDEDDEPAEDAISAGDSGLLDWLGSASQDDADQDDDLLTEDAGEVVPDWLAGIGGSDEPASELTPEEEDLLQLDDFGMFGEDDLLEEDAQESREVIYFAGSADDEEEDPGSAPAQPDWLAEIDAEDDEENVSDEFLFFSGGDDEEVADEEDAEDAVPNWLAGVSVADDAQTDDQDDNDDFLLFGQEDDELEEEEEGAGAFGFTLDETDEEDAEDAVPDWLAGVSVADDAQTDDQDDNDDFLLFGEEDDELEEEEGAGAFGFTLDETDEEDAEDAVPDWLAGVSVADDAQTDDQDDNDDFLLFGQEDDELEEEVEEEGAGAFGFTLDETDEEDAEDAVPDWLAGVSVADDAQTDDQDDNDDFLLFGEEDDELEEEEGAGAFAVASEQDEQMLDWLSDDHEDEDEDAIDTDEVAHVEQDIPDWLATADVISEEVGDTPDDDTPTWLSGIGEDEAEEDADAFAFEMDSDEDLIEDGEEEDAGVPDWLSDVSPYQQTPELTFDALTGDTGEEANLFDSIEDDAELIYSDEIEDQGYDIYNESYTDDETEEESVELVPANNAPDWLNAMVPGMDVDYEQQDEDDPIEDEYLTESQAVRAATDFDWLTEIVDDELRPPATLPVPGAVASPSNKPKSLSRERQPRFKPSRPPLWLQGRKTAEETPTDSDDDWLDFDDDAL